MQKTLPFRPIYSVGILSDQLVVLHCVGTATRLDNG